MNLFVACNTFLTCDQDFYVFAGILIILFFAVGVPMLLIAKIHELIQKHRATKAAAKDASRST